MLNDFSLNSPAFNSKDEEMYLTYSNPVKINSTLTMCQRW